MVRDNSLLVLAETLSFIYFFKEAIVPLKQSSL